MNLHIAHRKIPWKFGVPGYHRFCAAPPRRVCGGRTDRQTDGFAIARTNIVLQCSSKTVFWCWHDFWNGLPTRVVAKHIFFRTRVDQGVDAGFNLRGSTVRVQRAASLYVLYVQCICVTLGQCTYFSALQCKDHHQELSPDWGIAVCTSLLHAFWSCARCQTEWRPRSQGWNAVQGWNC